MSRLAEQTIPVGDFRSAGGDSTLLLACPICRSDDAEPIGVTRVGSKSETVVIRCAGCHAVYLSPMPNDDPGASRRERPGRRLTSRMWHRMTGHLPGTARILIADEALKDIPAGSNMYDLIIVSHTLESAADPRAFLKHVSSLLADDGLVISLTSNTDSSCFRSFFGRHWNGYRFPHANQLFNAKSLRELCRDDSPLRIGRMTSCFASEEWLHSVNHWLRDWGASALLISFLTGRWGIPQAAAALVEEIAVLRNRGSLLLAEFHKP